MSDEIEIRCASHQELPLAASFTASEEWVSENIDTFESFHLHDPGSILLAWIDKRPVGVCVATSYGSSGFIGELITLPELRNQGIGARLLGEAIHYLQQQGAQSIYLDGVVRAVPLYERNGFRKICRSLRFSGSLPGKLHPNVRRMLHTDLPAVCQLDLEYLTADRSVFLARRLLLYPQLCWVMSEGQEIVGFIMGRSGKDWSAAGPAVLRKAEDSILPLLESFATSLATEAFSLGVLASHPACSSLLRSLGFTERSDSPWRMVLGSADDLGASPHCWANGSAAKG
jgi:ribosomal protein S18 acetylase RimI-like enzyme